MIPDNTEARKQRKAEEKAHEGLKLVIDMAKLECSLCTVPLGILKVNFDTSTTQNKKTATVKEKDSKSLKFLGTCTKSPNSASPCASVMQLGEWKDVGTIKFQDELVLLEKSTIKCNYGGVDIMIKDSGQINVPINLNFLGLPIPMPKPIEFDVKIKLLDNKKTIVPLGIADYSGNLENSFIEFEVTITGKGIDEWELQIDNNDRRIYALFSNIKVLDEVVILSPKHKSKTHIKTVLQETTESDSVYPAGKFIINWDGFDKDEIYDSTWFKNQSITAKIIGRKNGGQKTDEIEFKTSYSEVNWVDIRINRNAKRIETTLRVDLKDGGATGLNCQTYTEDDKTISGEPNPFKDISFKICDWDKIPKNVIKSGKPIIKSLTKKFKDLEQLAIDGLRYHWGRNQNHPEGCNINIEGVNFEVYVNPLNTKENSMDDVDLVFITNYFELRSNNPGEISSRVSRLANYFEYIPYSPLNEKIFYNIGYCNRIYPFQSEILQKEDNWIYNDNKNGSVDKDYS